MKRLTETDSIMLPFDSQNPPATDEEIETLEEVAGLSLPPIYQALLKYSNGGEWPIEIPPFIFVMFDVDTVIGNLTGTDFAQVYPDCLPIGGDGMTEYIALDFSGGGEPRVVAIDATESDLAEALYLMTDTLDEFVKSIGREFEE